MPAQPCRRRANQLDRRRRVSTSCAIAPDGSAVMAGRAAPGTAVTVEEAGRTVGQAQADSRGAWVMVPTEKLAPGAGELRLTSREPNGAAVAAEAPVLVIVPSSSPPCNRSPGAAASTSGHCAADAALPARRACCRHLLPCRRRRLANWASIPSTMTSMAPFKLQRNRATRFIRCAPTWITGRSAMHQGRPPGPLGHVPAGGGPARPAPASARPIHVNRGRSPTGWNCRSSVKLCPRHRLRTARSWCSRVRTFGGWPGARMALGFATPSSSWPTGTRFAMRRLIYPGQVFRDAGAPTPTEAAAH